MGSLKRFSATFSGFRLTGSTIAAIAAAVIMVGGSAGLMTELLVRWETADRTGDVARHAERKAPPPTPVKLAKPETVRVLASVAKVKDAFSSAGYHLDAVRRGLVAVPRVRQVSLPYDLPQIEQPKDRKAVFLRFMLPYVLEANNRVRAQRERMLALREQSENGEALRESDAFWLDALFEEYRVEPGDFNALAIRIDTVPASLALAQAAVESGWGTSRFAQKGNAPFGQWTSKDNEGMVPLRRAEGLTHKVRSFKNLRKSVESYLRNLNTHRAYRAFRKARLAFRKKGEAIDSMAMAETLIGYSEKGQQYVTLLQRIIANNDLSALDSARLGDSVLLVHPDA